MTDLERSHAVSMFYQVMRATGQIESLLGLAAHSKFEKPEAGRRIRTQPEPRANG